MLSDGNPRAFERRFDALSADADFRHEAPAPAARLIRERSIARWRRTELRATPLLLALGCAGLGGVRPWFGPVPGAVVMEIEGTPEAVITAAAAEIAAESLRIRTLSAAEGYLETEWFDSASRAGAGRDPREFRRVVRIRIWADPSAGRTVLVAECVRRVFYDPSRPERELERMVPPGHAGRDILEAALTRLKERFGT